MSVIRDKLQNDESLDEKTCVSPECITQLFSVVYPAAVVKFI